MIAAGASRAPAAIVPPLLPTLDPLAPAETT